MAVLAREGLLHAAVEEVGDVRVLLRFGHAELCEAGPGQNVAEDVGDRARGEKDGVGEVVLVSGHRREVGECAPRAVEVGEVVFRQGCGELAGPVGAEVEEEDGVVGGDSAHPDHRRRQELVRRAFRVAAGDVFGRALRPWADSLDDRAVGKLGSRPAPVPVHGEVAP